jgi:hypothetical protein
VDYSLFPPILLRGEGPKSLRNSMASPISRFATRLAYGASQLPRVAWYLGHGVVMRQLSEIVRGRPAESTRPRAFTDAPVPHRRRLYADMAILFRQDLANVEAHERRRREARQAVPRCRRGRHVREMRQAVRTE